MRLRAARCPAAFGAVWIVVSVFAIEAYAEIEIVAHEFSGRFSVESRWFPETGAHPNQRSHASGFVAEPQLYLEEAEGGSFTLVPFFRYDSADPRRTHADLREAYLLLFGEIGNSEWELRLGVDRVFWGVTESQHLVDIINQVDFVEHPNGEVKLGQPMAHVTWSGDWGALELFSLPYHRVRTFPGQSGRLRFSFLVDDEHVQYESGAEEWHPDFAARYSHSVGSLDVGVSVFDGTSREASLICPRCPPPDEGSRVTLGVVPLLVQYYPQIRQFGLDAQLTLGSWLFKLEAMHRAGERNLIGLEKEYVASVVGGEYKVSSVFGSAADLDLLGEWNYDERGRQAVPRRSPLTLDNDFFFGVRLAFNDVQSTEISAGVLGDASRNTRTLAVEVDRRLSDAWLLHLESSAILSIDKADIQYQGRRDSFIELNLVYNF